MDVIGVQTVSEATLSGYPAVTFAASASAREDERLVGATEAAYRSAVIDAHLIRAGRPADPITP
jgi:hypothetical protein